MYNIVLPYDQLDSHIIIYTNVLFIVYWCTYMYMYLYSEQYYYTSSMEHSLYLYKSNVQGGKEFNLYIRSTTIFFTQSDHYPQKDVQSPNQKRTLVKDAIALKNIANLKKYMNSIN